MGWLLDSLYLSYSSTCVSRLDSNTTNESSQSRHTYEEVSSLEREYASQVSIDTTLPKEDLIHEAIDKQYHNSKPTFDSWDKRL